CTLALDVTLNQYWKLWKEANNKRYSNAEEDIRYAKPFSSPRFHLLILQKCI
ncbi:unnamed protein product, partial [Rotaria magnacalcarata]